MIVEYLYNKNLLHKRLVGKTIKSIEYMSNKESKYHYLSKKPIALRFTDGTSLIALKEDEVNKVGFIYFGG